MKLAKHVMERELNQEHMQKHVQFAMEQDR